MPDVAISVFAASTDEISEARRVLQSHGMDAPHASGGVIEMTAPLAIARELADAGLVVDIVPPPRSSAAPDTPAPAAPQARPGVARWLSIAGGLVASLGALVLLQQIGVAEASLANVLIALGSGVVLGVLDPINRLAAARR
jgi:hypothetical protein